MELTVEICFALGFCGFNGRGGILVILKSRVKGVLRFAVVELT